MRHGIVILFILLISGFATDLQIQHNRFTAQILAEENTPPASQKFRVEWNELKVLSNKTFTWPKGDWVPLKWSDYQKWKQLWKPRPPQPPPVQVKHAEYQAVFDGTSLVKGVFRAETVLLSESPQFLSLEPMELSVSRLVWMQNEQLSPKSSDPKSSSNGKNKGSPNKPSANDQQAEKATEQKAHIAKPSEKKKTGQPGASTQENGIPAIWGTASTGIKGVFVESANRTLYGEWTLSGRTLPRSAEFDLTIAPAASSTIRLKVPRNYQVKVHRGELTTSQLDGHSNWNLWTIYLGSQTSTHVSISKVETRTPGKPLLMSEWESDWTLSLKGIDYRGACQVEIVGKETDQLLFQVPSELIIDSISYGDELPLNFKRLSQSADKGLSRIRVNLPDKLQGRSRLLRFQGHIPPNQQTTWKLKSLSLIESILTSGQMQVAIKHPLTVKDFSLRGLKQTGAVSSKDDVEVLEFHQHQPAAELTLQTELRPRFLQGRIVSQLRHAQEYWEIASEIHWEVTSGEETQLELGFPHSWELVDVRNGFQKMSEKSYQWELTAEEEQQHLTIFLSEAVRPKRDVTLILKARTFPVQEETIMQLPFWTLPQCRQVKRYLVIPEDSRSYFRLLSHVEWKTVEKRSSIPWIRQSPFALTLTNDTQAPAELTELVPFPPGMEFPDTGEIAFSNESRFAYGMAALVAPELAIEVPEKMRQQEQEQRRSNQESEEELAVDLPVRCRLETSISAQSSSYDEHSLTYILGPLKHETTCRIHLPKEYVLTKVSRETGQLLPAKPEQEFELDLEPSESTQSITFSFRTAVGRSLVPRRSFPLPETSFAVTSFDWSLTLPSTFHLQEVSPFLVTEQAQPTARSLFPFLRPFSRSQNDFWFRFWVWEDWSAVLGISTGQHQSSHGEQAKQYQMSGLSYPTHLSIAMWTDRSSNLLGWIGLLGATLFCFLMRLAKLSRWRFLLALGLTLTLIAAWLSPAPWCSLVGGAFSGILLGSLIPLHLLQRDQALHELELGSTIDQPVHLTKPVSVIFWVGILLYYSSGFAQTDAIPVSLELTEGAEKRVSVLIPVKNLAQEEEKKPDELVYLSKNDFNFLKEKEEQSLSRVSWVISEANYEMAFQSQIASVTASYHVHVLNNLAQTTIRIPISQIRIGGEQVCWVNGKATSVFRDAQTQELLISVQRSHLINSSGISTNEKKSASESSAKADVSSAPEINNPQHASCVVKLRFHVPVKQSPFGGECGFDIPSVANSRLKATFDEPPNAFDVPEAKGVSETDETSHELTAELGAISRLRLFWSAQDQPLTPPSSLKAHTSCLVSLGENSYECHYRISYEVLRGQVPYVSFQLPPHSFVRSVSGSKALTYHQTQQSGYRVLLFVDFPKAQTKDFEIDVKLLLPAKKTSDVLKLPSLELFPSDRTQFRQTDSEGFELALTAPPYYEPELFIPEGSGEIVPIPEDSFLRRWPESSSVRGLSLIGTFRCTGALLPSCRLLLKQPQKSVRLNQIAKIGHEQVDWTIALEVQTSNVPAYRHELILDPSLMIDSISVKQDQAERLLRWSRIGNRVILFLKSPTIGIQTVIIQATMPWHLSDQTVIPELEIPHTNIVNAEETECFLVMSHPPSFQVQVIEEEMLKDVGDSVEATSTDQDLTIKKYQWIETNRNPVIRIQKEQPTLKYELETKIDTPTAGRFPFQSAFRFHTTLNHDLPPQIVIPKEVVSRTQISTVSAIYEKTFKPNGDLRLIVHPKSYLDRTCDVILTTDLEENAHGKLRLPGYSSGEAICLQRYWVCPRGWRPSALEAVNITRDVRMMPITNQFLTSDHQIFQTRQNVFSLVHEPIEIPKEQVSVPFVQTLVILQNNDRALGESSCYLKPIESQTHLSLYWPQGYQLRDCRQNGKLLKNYSLEGEQLLLTLEDQQPCILKVRWETTIPQSHWPIVSHQWTFPQPLHQQADRSEVLLVASRDRTFRERNSVTLEDTSSFTMNSLNARIHFLLQNFQDLPTELLVSEVMELESLYRSLQQTEQSMSSSQKQAFTDLKFLWQKTKEQIESEHENELEFDIADRPDHILGFLPSQDQEMQTTAPLNLSSSPGENGRAQSSVLLWLVNERWFDLLIGILCAILLLPLLYLLLHERVVELFNNNFWISSVVLALFCWMMLKGSHFSFAALIVLLTGWGIDSWFASRRSSQSNQELTIPQN